jgi:hypothetical protein
MHRTGKWVIRPEVFDSLAQVCDPVRMGMKEQRKQRKRRRRSKGGKCVPRRKKAFSIHSIA